MEMLKSVDVVKVALVILVAAMAVAAMSGLAVTSANRRSETLVLGFTTLLGAMALFGAQLFFQLRSSEEESALGAQVLVNTQTMTLGPYQGTNGFRAATEHEASDWLRQQKPDAFGQDHLLGVDMVVYSIVSYLAAMELDWQMKRTRYHFTGPMGAFTEFQLKSQSSASEAVPVERLVLALQASGNHFAGAPVIAAGPQQSILLPRGTVVSGMSDRRAASNTFTLDAPAITVRFTVQLSQKFSGIPQRAEGGPWVIAGQGGPLKLQLIKVLLTMSLKAHRANDPNVDAYRAWFARLTEGLQDWFGSSAAREAPAGQGS